MESGPDNQVIKNTTMDLRNGDGIYCFPWLIHWLTTYVYVPKRTTRH